MLLMRRFKLGFERCLVNKYANMSSVKQNFVTEILWI